MKESHGFILTTLFTFIFIMMFILMANVFMTLDRMNHFNLDASLIIQRNGGVNARTQRDIQNLQSTGTKYRQFKVEALDSNGHVVTTNDVNYGEKINYRITTKLMFSMFMPLKTVSKDYSITSNIRSNSV